MLDSMAETVFADRRAAGRALGARLTDLDPALADPLVLGLPRGGVVVAAAAAEVLGAELDVLVARKLGHPDQPEFALGALAEGGEPVWDPVSLRRSGLDPGDPELARVVAAERAELARRVTAYRGARRLTPTAGRAVVLVDDGIATGATARAALRALRGRPDPPARLVLAVPVGAPGSLAALSPDADTTVALLAPRGFTAVGRWYAAFGQTPDREVLDLLARRPGRRSR